MPAGVARRADEKIICIFDFSLAPAGPDRLITSLLRTYLQEMGKILVIVSIIITAATAALGYINRTHLQETSDVLDTTKDNLAKTTATLAKTEKDLKSTKETLQSTIAEKEQITAELNTTKSDLKRTRDEVTTLNTQIAEKTAEIEAKLAENAGLKTELEALRGKEGESGGKIKDLENQIAENKLVISKLEGDVSDARGKVSALTKEKNDRKELQRKNNFDGRVLAVNQAWNFVVLNLGDRNGITNNVEMLVKRGGQLVGKVRVTSVEPSTSIADIVSGSIPGGLSVQPGDQVVSIYEDVKD